MRRGARVWAGALVIAAVLVPSLPAASQDDPPRMTSGEWTALGLAGGIVSRQEAGLDIQFGANFRTQFRFTVRDGSSTGSWSGTGTGLLHGQGDSGGQRIIVNLGNEYTSEGELSGSDAVLNLTGTVSRSASGLVTVGTQSTPIGGAETSAVEPTAFTVTIAQCREAQGNFALVWSEQLQDTGWSPGFSGSWTAVRQSGDADVAQITADVEELVTDFYGLNDVTSRPADSADPDGLAVLSLPSPPSRSTLRDLLTRAEALTNQLRNIDRCEAAEFGAAGVALHFNILTSIILGTISAYAEPGNRRLTSSEITLLLSAGQRTGALGSGSRLPGQAAQAEESLRLQAEGILSRAVPSGGESIFGTSCADIVCIDLTEETKNVIATGVQQGWGFTVEGESLDAPVSMAREGRAPGFEFS